ncbi:potassium channel family protein [Oceanivirga miroungae]|uniref:TrkA-N domain-containing protein n=1 Tax=Oceanivirga miroungae TaxID=1130046 RepID=A0A6I8MDX9_9FUSO|nr:TrkA family potassium uptake protein [Oceanivirga miroungae]VWL85394.1 TrkA-N domain-containing protein [Oceanivirga miroungae]
MKNYLVIGLGKFGITIAKTLYDAGNFVLAIDSNLDKVQKVLDEGIVEEAITLDATDENGLGNIAKDSFDAAFVCIGTNVQNSILVTLMLKEMNIKKIICKATTKIQGKVLQKVGATQIVYPEEFMGEKIAYSVMHPSVIEYFNFSDDYCIFDVNIPQKFIGKSLKELDLRHKYMVNVIAIKDKSGTLNITPSPEYEFSENDTLIVLGENKAMGEMID